MCLLIGTLARVGSAEGESRSDTSSRPARGTPESSNAAAAEWLEAAVRGERCFELGEPPVEFRFRFVAPGQFSFGLDPMERIALARESGNLLLGHNAVPVVRVRISRGFWMLDREITREQYEALEGAPALNSRPAWAEIPQDVDRPQAMPRSDVSWQDADRFCDRLSRSVGCVVRLPREVEWEYAARGPISSLFPWTVPWFERRRPWEFDRPRASPDGSVAAIPFHKASTTGDRSWCGVVGLADSLSEWCLDPYVKNLHQEMATEDEFSHDPWTVPASAATVTSEKRDCVHRGGNFGDAVYSCASALRRSLYGGTSDLRIGFRPVLIPLPFPPARNHP